MCRPCSYTTHSTKQHTGLYSDVSCDCARSTAHNTRLTQAAIIPPAPRWSVYTRPDALNLYQIQPPRRDAAQVSTAAYYNKVYKRADHASGGGSAPTVCGSLATADTLSAVQARRGAPAEGSAAPPVNLARVIQAGQSSSRGTAGGAEPLTAVAVSLFGLSPDS